MMLVLILFIAHSDILMVNGGGYRVARSPLDPHPNCEAGLLTNTYSEFILREQVTIGPGDQPQKDGVAATCGGRCKIQCYNPNYNPGSYPGWNICFGSKIKQTTGEWKFQSSPPNGPWYIECKCRHSKICRNPGQLCGPKGYQPCPADAPADNDPRPDWVDGKNTGFEDQGLSQGVTSTTPDPDAK